MIKSFLIFPQSSYPFWNPGWTLEREVLFYAIAALVAPFFGIRVLAAVLFTLAGIGMTATFASCTKDLHKRVGTFICSPTRNCIWLPAPSLT